LLILLRLRGRSVKQRKYTTGHQGLHVHLLIVPGDKLMIEQNKKKIATGFRVEGITWPASS